ncbi:MAG: hypothetical protein RIG62_24410 [Cyclobacteriaceae bacterium]
MNQLLIDSHQNLLIEACILHWLAERQPVWQTEFIFFSSHTIAQAVGLELKKTQTTCRELLQKGYLANQPATWFFGITPAGKKYLHKRIKAKNLEQALQARHQMLIAQINQQQRILTTGHPSIQKTPWYYKLSSMASLLSLMVIATFVFWALIPSREERQVQQLRTELDILAKRRALIDQRRDSLEALPFYPPTEQTVKTLQPESLWSLKPIF